MPVQRDTAGQVNEIHTRVIFRENAESIRANFERVDGHPPIGQQHNVIRPIFPRLRLVVVTHLTADNDERVKTHPERNIDCRKPYYPAASVCCDTFSEFLIGKSPEC